MTNQFTTTLVVVPKVHESGIATTSLCVSQKYLARREAKKETFDLASSTSASVFLTSFLVTSRRSSLRASVRTNGSLYFPAESPVEKGPLSPQSLPESFPLVLLGFMETTIAAPFDMSLFLMFEGRAAIALISCRCAQYFILFCLRPQKC